MRILFAILIATAVMLVPKSAQAQLTFTGTMVSDTSLTIDSNLCSSGPQYSFIAFRLTNTGATVTGAYVDLNDTSTVIVPANGQATRQFVGTWASGASKTFFWYMSYGCVIGKSVQMIPKVTSSSGATATITTLRPVKTASMLSSNGGGQLVSGAVGPGAIIGQLITSDIVYDFGGVNAGDTYHMQPAGTGQLNAACFQLVKTEVVSSNITAIPATAASNNQLFFTAGVGQSGNGYNATVRYYFKYKCTGTGSQLNPYTNQLSGRQLKYSGNWSSFIGPTMPAATNPLTVTKTVSPSVLTAAGTVTYTVTIKNPSAYATRIDSIADVLPSGVTFGAISGASGITAANSSSTPASGASGTLKFTNIADSTYTLAAGDSLKLIYTANVTGTPGTYVNSATPYIANVAIGTASATVNVGVADYSITKTHTGNFTVGTNGDYTITVKNTGTLGGANVVVTDTLPTGLSYVSATSTRGTWTFSNTGQVVTASMASGPIVADSAKFTLTVLPALAAVSSVTNTARVAGSYETNTANNSASDATTVYSNVPDLTISKAATNTFTSFGNANYTITITNVGAATTANVVVVDTLPAGLTYSSASGTNWTFGISGQVLTATYSGPALATSATSSFSIVAAIGSAAYPTVTNRAYVSGGGDTNITNNAASPVTTSVTGAPDVKLTKTSSASFTPGSTGTYTLKVDNVGTTATTANVVVSDTFPAGITYSSLSGTSWASTSSGTLANGRQWRTFTYSGAALAASTGTTTLTVTVSIAAAGSATVTNRGWVSGGGNTYTLNDSSSVSTNLNASDLTIAKAAGTLTYGSNGTYTITVTNSGNLATTGTITARDTLPANVAYVSATGTGWTLSHANGVVTGTRTTAIAAGGNSAFTITVTINSTADSVTNRAFASGGGQINVTNDSTRITTAIVFPLPNVTMVKSITNGASGGQVLPGADLTYNIHFQNTGAGSAVGVVVSDNLPAEVQFKLNSITTTIDNGITATVQYYVAGAWTSSIVDGGCGAPTGYNACVTKVRWTLQSALPTTKGGDLYFVARVK